MSSVPPLDEGRSSRHSSDSDISGGVTDSGATNSTGGGSGNLASVYGAVCAAVPALLANCASAAAAAAEEAIMGDAGGGEMGARLDAPAALSFGAVVVAFAFLQVNSAVLRTVDQFQRYSYIQKTEMLHTRTYRKRHPVPGTGTYYEYVRVYIPGTAAII